MKRVNFLFLIIFIALAIVIGGCTVNRPGTQTRLGNQFPRTETRLREGTPNNDLNLRRDDNLLGENRTAPDDMLRRERDLGPGSITDREPMNQNNVNTMNERARAIADRVSNLDEVDKSSVLISGKTAIVGVNIKNNTKGQVTSDLKKKVERTVKDFDNSIDNVNVTANPDLFSRISAMAKDIDAGRPVSGFVREFQEILRRISPIR